jgi:hypothetical protein
LVPSHRARVIQVVSFGAYLCAAVVILYVP